MVKGIFISVSMLMPLCGMAMEARKDQTRTFYDAQTIYSSLCQHGYRALLDATQLHTVLGRATTTEDEVRRSVYQACATYASTYQKNQGAIQSQSTTLIGLLNNLTVPPAPYGSWRDE